MDIKSLHFRTAQLGDSDALVDLVNSAYRGEVSKKGWTTEADILGGQRTDREAIVETMNQKDSVFFLAEDSTTNKILASVHLQKKNDKAYFGMFSVDPHLQNGGIGKLVISAAERFAVERWGSSEMFMTVITIRHELISWYKRRGYKCTGEIVPFPYGDERFGIPMRPDLVMEVLSKKLS